MPQDALTFARCGGNRGDAMCRASKPTQQKREKKSRYWLLQDECVDMILEKTKLGIHSSYVKYLIRSYQCPQSGLGKVV